MGVFLLEKPRMNGKGEESQRAGLEGGARLPAPGWGPPGDIGMWSVERAGFRGGKIGCHQVPPPKKAISLQGTYLGRPGIKKQ